MSYLQSVLADMIIVTKDSRKLKALEKSAFKLVQGIEEGLVKLDNIPELLEAEAKYSYAYEEGRRGKDVPEERPTFDPRAHMTTGEVEAEVDAKVKLGLLKPEEGIELIQKAIDRSNVVSYAESKNKQ